MGTNNNKTNAAKRGIFTSAGATQKIVVILVIVALAVFFSVMSKPFRQYATLVSIFDYSYYISFMAIGVTFALITGGVDLSIGTGMITCGLVGGYVIAHKAMPVGVGILVALVIGLLFGLINAMTVAVMELPPFIATLCSMMLARGIGSILTGALSVTWPPAGSEQGWVRSFFKYKTEGGLLIPVGFLLVIIAVIVMSLILNHTRPGRYIIAIGSNKEATRLSGIKVRKYQGLAYLICGLFTGIAGIAYSCTFQAVAPGSGAGLELDAIAGAIIGGTSMNGGYGTITGTLLGVYVMSLLKTGLPYIGLQSNWQQIVTGIILIIAVLVDVLKNTKGK
ncbi:MAG: ABC transporter permease [Lachnospiraceae bacterium]|jgi:ribose transport system permease protein|nr:ABC transporter permease [Lachnospiraceae bacterium]